MKDYDIDNTTGAINFEIHNEDGALVSLFPKDGMNVKLNNEELTQLAKWLVARLNVGKGS